MIRTWDGKDKRHVKEIKISPEPVQVCNHRGTVPEKNGTRENDTREK